MFKLCGEEERSVCPSTSDNLRMNLRQTHRLFLSFVILLFVLPFRFPFYFANYATLDILLTTTCPDFFHLHPALLILSSQNLIYFKSFTKTHFRRNIRRSLPFANFYSPTVNACMWLERVITRSDSGQTLWSFPRIHLSNPLFHLIIISD